MNKGDLKSFQGNTDGADVRIFYKPRLVTIFYPIFHDHFIVFKEVFSINFVLTYGAHTLYVLTHVSCTYILETY